jgi:hypothetical protein
VLVARSAIPAAEQQETAVGEQAAAENPLQAPHRKAQVAPDGREGDFMIEESAMSGNWTAHSGSSVSLPRRVASREPAWVAMAAPLYWTKWSS